MKTNNTIQLLEQRQCLLKGEIKKSSKKIAYRWQELFSPPQADTKVQQWVVQAERALAIYDGFMMMYKLGRRFNKVTQLFKKKRKRSW